MIYPAQTCECGQTFFPDSNNERLCRKCLKAQEGWTNGKILSCPICLADFRQKAPGQKYCLPACAIEAQARTRRGRFMIFERDHFRCIYCGKSPIEDNGIILHVDHIFPKLLGGLDIAENLVTACSDCNLEKSAMMLRPKDIKRILRQIHRRNKQSSISNEKVIKLDQFP